MPDGSEVEVPLVSVAGEVGATVRRLRGSTHSVRDQGGPVARPWAATGCMEVEALAVWAYRDQRVGRDANAGMHTIEVEASGGFRSSWSTDGCAALGEIAHMGCRVETYGRVLFHDVHPAAEAVAWAVERIDHGRDVAFWARQGGRPTGWRMPRRQFCAVQWVEPWVEASPITVRGKPHHCEIIRTASTEGVEDRRRDYVQWWDALDTLAWELSMRALGFAVLRPSAPRTPWIDGEAA